MHVLSVFSHPHRNSFSGALLDSFVRGVADAGHTSEIADLYRVDFSPVMSQRDLQQFDNVVMPDDVLREQARVERSDALCFIFPIWWYSMPAMIKGWLDRVWSAGWAYQPAYIPEGSLLDSRPCTLLVPTGTTPSHMEQWRYDQEIDHVWRYGVLGYCGVDPIRIHFLLDSQEDTGKGTHAAHLETVYNAGLIACDKED